jgi:membrane protein DedA with SNARE-associated domain
MLIYNTYMIDFLPDQETLILWLTQYGSFTLFGLLALGIIALPVPEETLMVLSGILIHQEHLPLLPTLLAAYAGSMIGITASYLIGRLAGNYVLKRYGKWVGMNEARIQKMHNWFERYGKWALIIGYFVPGVRHWTGVFAGLSNLEYHTFAFFAYLGAFLWVSLFIAIGYFCGVYWLPYLEQFEIPVDVLTVLAILAVAALLVWKYWPLNDARNSKK